MIDNLVATTEHILPPDTRVSSEAIFVESPSPEYEQELINTVNNDFDISLVKEVYCGDCGGILKEATRRRNPFDPEEAESQYRRNPFIGLLLIPIKVGVKVLVAVVKIVGKLFAKVGKALIKIIPKAAKAGVKVAKKGAKVGAKFAKKGLKMSKKMFKKAMKAGKKVAREFDEYLEEREREALISEKVSLQTKLETLKKLKEKGTITPEAYAEAVAAIG